MAVRSNVVVSKTWRSEIETLGLCVVCCIASIVLTWKFPGSIISGYLFSIGNTSIYLSLPLWWLLPGAVFLRTIQSIYDVCYIVDGRGIEAREGILSLNHKVTRVRFEDIRSVETEQTLIERFLDIGDVEIGTAGTSGIEMMLEGVGSPMEIINMIQAERDRRAAFEKTPVEVRNQAQM